MAELPVDVPAVRIWPQPRHLAAAPDLEVRLPVRVEASRALAGPARLLDSELRRLLGPAVPGRTPGTRVRLELSPSSLPHAEEYALTASGSTAVLRAHDLQGAYWAVHTFVGLLEGARRVPSGFRAAGATVRDWPESPSRAFMIQGAWTPSLDAFRRNLDLLARMKVRTFALEFGPQVVLDLDPRIATGARFTKAQARGVIDYGRSLGLEPIGYLNLLGHLDRAYQKAPYTDHGGVMIQRPETYAEFVYPLLKEMLDVYGPIKAFHCGMDEAWELFTWFSSQGIDGARLLAAHVGRVRDFLHDHGVRLVIWHDMFLAPDLAKELGAPIGPANGGPPQNSAAALGSLPRDVILDYWFYDPEPAYPALDYLRRQGFEVWASPWTTPFGLVRYAQARRAPTLGTLWDAPPWCFASPIYGPVTALYAQAAWDPSAAPEGKQPEPAVVRPAMGATGRTLWGRRTLSFAGRRALLLSPNGSRPPRRLAWPDEAARAPEQHGGVPFDFGAPARFGPLQRARRQVDAARAGVVVLPGGDRLVLDGVNTGRGEDQLILYASPRTRTGTNVYGVEAAVSDQGAVVRVTPTGTGDHDVPPGGFVLSAHEGPNGSKARRLQDLRPGDLVGVLDARGDWVGGAEPIRLAVSLPGGALLRANAVDAPRAEDALVVYLPGFDRGRTETNAYGVEVLVRAGRVAEVRPDAGNSAIPADGCVLSAHGGATGAAATALRRLRPTDPVTLLLEHAGRSDDLAGLLASRRASVRPGTPCRTIYAALATDTPGSPDGIVGHLVVRFADGAVDRSYIRYGQTAVSLRAGDWPRWLSMPAWLVERAGDPGRCLVTEWNCWRPTVPIADVSVEPAFPSLETGLHLLAVTCALA